MNEFQQAWKNVEEVTARPVLFPFLHPMFLTVLSPGQSAGRLDMDDPAGRVILWND